MNAYESFIARKALVVPATGITGAAPLSPKLKEHQRLLTAWALRRGRAAIFADTGLGKGWMVLEWARAVAWHTSKPVLVLAPLAVSQQFEREAAKLYLRPELTICSSQADVQHGINVTNYQKLHKFDLSRFSGVALDESSILKSLDGKTRAELIEACRDVPFRLSATATPSPNDHTELGGQAEFLGVMKHSEMLATFFINDLSHTGDWRLKGHARELFWKWVCSWGAIVKMPSDLGCSDEGYLLPPLVYHEHVVPADHQQAHATGLLFAQAAETLTDQRRARKGSLSRRVQIAADIANTSSARGHVIVWCDLNDESKALAKAIDDSVELTGSMSDDEKEEAIRAFVAGEKRVLVSKPSLCGFGLNFQFARTVVFCGVTHSFEAFYQAVRRSWRFGVDGSVDVHIVTSELEGRVVESLKLKAAAAAELSSETSKFVARYVRASLGASVRETIAYEPTREVKWPKWMKTEAA
jgi:superfamily II DNA or RNA helicase